jgi:SAM-dependent methyltransferase
LLNLNKKSKKLLLLQRNELLTEKQKWRRKRYGRFLFTNLFINFNQANDITLDAENLFKNEIDTFKDFLPKTCKNIMDIGCGLGIINILLNKFYKDTTSFYLLDKNRIDKKIKYGFSPNYESYNDLNETKRILLENNINENNLFLFDVEKDIKIDSKIDLVISLKSMGYHYPIETYLQLLRKCCNQDTIFIFDVSEGYFNENSFKKYFENIKIIYEEKSIHSLKRLLCNGLKFN